MGDLDGVTESTGNKEKVSKWKLYRSQIKRLKENSKPDISTKKVQNSKYMLGFIDKNLQLH